MQQKLGSAVVMVIGSLRLLMLCTALHAAAPTVLMATLHALTMGTPPGQLSCCLVPNATAVAAEQPDQSWESGEWHHLLKMQVIQTCVSASNLSLLCILRLQHHEQCAHAAKPV
jgi:hypothetical protein